MKIDTSLEEQLLAMASSDGIARVVVGAAILQDGRMLLLRRREGDYLDGIYELPSGVVETGESLGQALSREVLEETGLRLKGAPAYLGSFDYFSGSGRPTRQFNFQASVESGDCIRLSEHDAFTWANRSDLDDIPVSVEVRNLLEPLLPEF